MRPTAQPRHHREDGRDHRARSDRAREPAAGLRARRRCPRSWCCPTCGARSRRCGARSRCFRRPARTAIVVQVVDPAEETFPYSGRIEFLEPEDGRSITAGRAENWRADYRGARRAPSRRDPRRDRPARLELHHPPHRPAGERAAARAAQPHGRRDGALNRWPRGIATREVRMIGACRSASRSRWSCSACISLPVLWWLLRLVPPRPRRIEFPPTRLLFDITPKEETPVAHAVVADAAAPDARRARHHRGRRPAVESAARDRAGARAARAADRRRLGRGRDLGHPRCAPPTT